MCNVVVNQVHMQPEKSTPPWYIGYQSLNCFYPIKDMQIEVTSGGDRRFGYTYLEYIGQVASYTYLRITELVTKCYYL